ncbi:hypothetical protein TorRG33x02_027710 [Trema orientale]|uniref:Uncharacterized protein n=1 Tax=Trema orientale TaxID=63057 RepID=A0A2P5FUK5_TREOI|nr:hypothetical protein TorRG33x02_027710 [Trema orientale]
MMAKSSRKMMMTTRQIQRCLWCRETMSDGGATAEKPNGTARTFGCSVFR